jgi:uncharacterized protein
MAQLEGKEWTLLAIALAKEKGLSPVQLQKSLFLLGKQMSTAVGPTFYTFDAYNYGPFSRAIYEDAEAWEALGMVAFMDHRGGDWTDYSITPAGTQAASRIATRANRQAVAYLAKVVDWASALSFDELVKAIYARYPEFKENSVFRG